MKQQTLTVTLAGVLVAAATAIPLLRAQAVPADLILSNGKIITVDERFTIAQAVAITGERIVAVGTNQEVARLAGPETRRIDLRGRAALPGLIDSHMHLLRAGITWQQEVRWDGLDSRAQALDLLRTRARAARPGEWVYNLGGWTLEQFADSRPFTRAELDQVAPDNPVLVQEGFLEAFLNSRALQAFGIDEKAPADEWVERDAAGRPTGRIGEAGWRQLIAKIPTPPVAEIETSTRAMIGDLNRAGLTSFGSAGCEPDLLRTYRAWADEGRLNIRVFCITGEAAATPQDVEQVLPRIARMKLFQGDYYIDHIAYGEGLYAPLSDPVFSHRSETRAEDLVQWRRLATELARSGLPLHVHTNFEETIDAFLDQIEAVNREYPIKNLRWVLAHLNQPNARQLERMQNLGMYATVQPWATTVGGINHRLFGDAAYDMAPLRTIQGSGIVWGFGSDANRLTQYRPFTTLWWAVTGKMVGGRRVLRQTISREDALIAHTRKNAYLIFQEGNLGSIQPGRLADLVVLDRDYLTIPADQIKDITSVMTVVGGRIVYDAGAPGGNR